jgi:protein-S-isoprenylcysteine O-methyltransferase Ste14
MNLDFVFIALLTWLMGKATGGIKGIGDLGGCIIASTLLYAIMKLPIYLCLVSFVYPLPYNFTYNLISGSIGFVVVGAILYIALRKRQRLEIGKENDDSNM